MRIVILRPSAILSTLSQPFEGWIDTASGIGHVTFPLAMGWSQIEHIGSEDQIIDFIPAEFVSNGILMTAATVHSPLSQNSMSSTAAHQSLILSQFRISFLIN